MSVCTRQWEKVLLATYKMKPHIFLVFAILFVLVSAFTLAPRAYYSEKHPILDEVKRRFRIIDARYAHIPLRTGGKSYTENKSVITLCVVNPETGEFYDINTIMYVALHELAHVITKADGAESHGDEFKGNFASLLKQAQIKGVYDARMPIPITYCGIGPED